MKKVVFILTLLLLAGYGFGLNPTPSVYFYHHHAWMMEDGLPQNSVLAIAQTLDGYLWLGTESGVARFDGIKFDVFNHENTPAITSDFITSLLADSSGALWIGTRGGGIVRLKDGVFDALTTKDGLLHEEVWSFMESRDRSIWIGTRSGVNRFSDGKITTVPLPDPLSKSWIRTMMEDRNGWVWIGTRTDGLYVIKKRDENYECEFKGLSALRIYALLEDREGIIWVGTIGGGLVKIQGNRQTFYTTKEGLSCDNVDYLHEDQSGNLWIATYGNGINLLKGGKKNIVVLDDTDLITSSVILSFLEDREGSLWIGTEGGGLNRLRDVKVTTYTMKNKLSNNILFGAFEDSRGNIWTGTKGHGVNCLDPVTNQVRVYNIRDGLSSNFVVSIAENPEGYVWFGTIGGGVNRLNLKTNRVDVFDMKDGLIDTNVGALYVDRENILWAGTHNGGIHCFLNGKFTLYKNLKYRVNSILKDRQGNMWVGTYGQGLCQLKDGKSECFKENSDSPIKCSIGMYEDDEGLLWICVVGVGLNCYKDGKFIKIGKKEGLPDETVYSILEDRNHNLWMSSNRGIFCVLRKEIESFLKGNTNRLNCTLFGKEDGMRSTECNGGSQPASCRSRDGKMWFPTTKGISVLDPENIPTNTIPPPVQIENVLIDGKAYPMDKKVVAPPGKGNLSFQYTGLSFIVPKRITFKYKLEGLDDKWVDAGTERTAVYSDIPPGTYTFRVIAKNSDGVWNNTGASFRFKLEPRFYQTLGFKVFFPLGLLVSAFLFYFSSSKYLWYRNLRKKLKKTSLTPEEGESCLKKVIYAMEVEKAYRDPDITLQKFSTKLKMSSRAISIVINERLKKNFVELINYYRVKEAGEMFMDPKKKNMSILEIAYEVGFNSKSSFNRVFKQIQKVTPSAFRNKENNHSSNGKT